MEVSMWIWGAFGAFIMAMLALDLGVFHRTAHEVKLKEALAWSGVWGVLALLFNAGVYYVSGSKPGLEFLTGYLIEKALSVDNVFIFAVLFAAFKVPKHCEHKILFWGVFGALLMRGIMIFAGIALIERFHWLVYVFGAFLIVTGLKMLRPNPNVTDPQNHWFIRWCRKFLRVTPAYCDDKFLMRVNGMLHVTPLLLVLLMVEFTDLVFAVDSIPAILAVSSNTFIVFTSNVFAMLGLRSLYFALSGMLGRFCYLKYGLSGILCFVGFKMLPIHDEPIPIVLSLCVVAGLLVVSIGASLLRTSSKLEPVAIEARA